MTHHAVTFTVNGEPLCGRSPRRRSLSRGGLLDRRRLSNGSRGPGTVQPRRLPRPRVSEAQIAVHWREEEYFPPPPSFVAQANADGPGDP